MIRKLGLAFLLCVALSSQPTWAAKKVVAANLTDNFVGVSEGFDGAKLTVFGVLKNKADAIVVIEGPLAEAKVRAKTKQIGIWVNGNPTTIESVPSFYAVVSSKPIDQIVDAKTALAYGLDVDHLAVSKTEAGAGYVNVKRAQGLFRYQPDGVKILESNLFRADIFLPPSVPIGTFRAHIYEVSSGKLSATRDETFYVAQVGMTAWVSKTAREKPAFYALLALVLSLGIGGGAAYLLRRMS
ncbi:MAG: TIGR02186 family protein [Alphaproteobacteria bacterium]|nr:TIGR02186 family protein [Alphaproteobacteria bacterium]